MPQINYQHLRYFFTVAREGSVVKAADSLSLSPQTISGQLSVFEDYLGVKLFDRKGKRLLLNNTGKVVYGYAEDIFALGNELQNVLSGQNIGQQFVFSVGIVDVIPKIFSFNLLRTCFELEDPLRLVCREGDLDTLLAELALGKIDLILSDRPLAPGGALKAYNHLLGESGLTFYADKASAKSYKKHFPQSLDQKPFLIGSDNSSQQINLLSWFDELGINPLITAEFDDSALMKFFGQSGYGVFCTPTTIEKHVTKQYKVSIIGRTDEVRERFYAISPERKLKHPGVKLLVDTAKMRFN